MIIARNLMLTPRWPSEELGSDEWGVYTSGTGGGFTTPNIGTSSEANPVDNGEGHCLTVYQSRPGTMYAYLQPGIVEPGARIRLGVRVNTSAEFQIGLRPEATPSTSTRFNIAAVTGSNIKVLGEDWSDKDLSSFTADLPMWQWEWSEHTLVIPSDLEDYWATDPYGEPVTPLTDPAVRWAVCMWNSEEAMSIKLGGIRLDTDDYAEPVAGYIDGSMTAEGRTYAWSGEPFQSQTTVTVESDPGDPDPGDPDPGDPDPGDPDPGDPDPGDGSSIIPQQVIERGGQRVADALGWSEDRLDEARAAYETTLLIAWAYTRGVGFTDDLVPAYPISRAAELAACRLAPNPEQLTRWQLGSDSETMPGFTGFTLAERHVLDRYRVRWA